jgi:hypothetical protein
VLAVSNADLIARIKRDFIIVNSFLAHVSLYFKITIVSNMAKGKAKIRPIGTVRTATGKKKICHNCGLEATHIASFDIDQATLVEYYCEKHVKSIKIE